jgi:hypothetical protein
MLWDTSPTVRVRLCAKRWPRCGRCQPSVAAIESHSRLWSTTHAKFHDNPIFYYFSLTLNDREGEDG